MGRFVDGYATLLVRDECGAGSPLLGNQQRCHELNIGNLHYLRSIMTMGFVEAASTSSGVVMGFLRFGSGASDNYVQSDVDGGVQERSACSPMSVMSRLNADKRMSSCVSGSTACMRRTNSPAAPTS